jgi:endonuclease/exonuclease/phosphatase family metal-dependent hydrolase
MKFISTFIFLIFSLTFSQNLWSNVSFKLATYNIRNFDQDNRDKIRTDQKELQRILVSLQADIIAVQEIVNVAAFKTFLAEHLKTYDMILSNCGGSGSQHLGFVYNKNKVVLKKSWQDDRLIMSENCGGGVRPAFLANFHLTTQKIDILAMAVHLKAGSKPKDLEKRKEQYKILNTVINEQLKQFPNMAILGDFNTTDHVPGNPSYRDFNEFLDQVNFLDLSAELECTAYWSGTKNDGLEYPSLLDHVLVSKNWHSVFKQEEVNNASHCQKVSCDVNKADQLGVSYTHVSDHCPVVTTFSSPQPEQRQ